MTAYIERDMSGYVAITVNELANLKRDKERLDWLEQNVYALSASEYSPRFVIWNQPNGGDAIDESIRALIDTVREMGVTNHDPRKGAE